MQIVFETAWLAPGQYQSVDGFRLNGEQIIDEASFFRAANKTFFPRGNSGIEVSFVVHWSFPTTLAAEVFALTHYGTLPNTNADNGPLQCICGAENPATAQTVYMANAVLRSARLLKYVGTSVDFEYTVQGAAFQTGAPSNVPAYPNQNEIVPVFRRGKVAITNGATSVAVTFSSPLPGTPGADPYCWVSGPTGAPEFECWTLTDTVTTLGFTATLGAAAPSGSYFLNYACFM